MYFKIADLIAPNTVQIHCGNSKESTIMDYFAPGRLIQIRHTNVNNGVKTVASRSYSNAVCTLILSETVFNETTKGYINGDIYELNFTDDSVNPPVIVTPHAFNTETSLNIPGRGTKNTVKQQMENMLHILERFASTGSPAMAAPRNPVLGQLWYDHTEEETNVWDGSDWIYMFNPAYAGINFIDPQNPINPAARVYLTASESGVLFQDKGFTIYPEIDTGVPSDSILRILSYEGSERLRVEQNAYISTTNAFRSITTPDLINSIANNLAIGATGSGSAGGYRLKVVGDTRLAGTVSGVMDSVVGSLDTSGTTIFNNPVVINSLATNTSTFSWQMDPDNLAAAIDDSDAIIKSQADSVLTSSIDDYLLTELDYHSNLNVARVGDLSYLPLDVTGSFEGPMRPYDTYDYPLVERDGALVFLRHGYDGVNARLFYSYSKNGDLTSTNSCTMTNTQYHPGFLTATQYVTNLYGGSSETGFCARIYEAGQPYKYYWIEHNGTLDGVAHTFIDVTNLFNLFKNTSSAPLTYLKEINRWLIYTLDGNKLTIKVFLGDNITKEPVLGSPPNAYHHFVAVNSVNMTTTTGPFNDYQALPLITSAIVSTKPFNASNDIDDVTNTVTITSHGFSDGDVVKYGNNGGTSVGGLVTEQYYYICNKTNDTFQLSATYNDTGLVSRYVGGISTPYPQVIVDISPGTGDAHQFIKYSQQHVTNYQINNANIQQHYNESTGHYTIQYIRGWRFFYPSIIFNGVANVVFTYIPEAVEDPVEREEWETSCFIKQLPGNLIYDPNKHPKNLTEGAAYEVQYPWIMTNYYQPSDQLVYDPFFVRTKLYKIGKEILLQVGRQGTDRVAYISWRKFVGEDWDTLLKTWGTNYKEHMSIGTGAGGTIAAGNSYAVGAIRDASILGKAINTGMFVGENKYIASGVSLLLGDAAATTRFMFLEWNDSSNLIYAEGLNAIETPSTVELCKGTASGVGNAPHGIFRQYGVKLDNTGDYITTYSGFDDFALNIQTASYSSTTGKLTVTTTTNPNTNFQVGDLVYFLSNVGGSWMNFPASKFRAPAHIATITGASSPWSITFNIPGTYTNWSATGLGSITKHSGVQHKVDTDSRNGWGPRILTASRAGFIVTLTTQVPHGLTTNDWIQGLNIGFGGSNVLSQVTEIVDAYSFKYTGTSQGLIQSTPQSPNASYFVRTKAPTIAMRDIKGLIERDPLIRGSHKSASLSYNVGDGVVTATVNNHGYSAGWNIEITGVVETGFNGFHIISNVTTNTFDFQASPGLLVGPTLTGNIESNGQGSLHYTFRPTWLVEGIWVISYAVYDDTVPSAPVTWIKFFTAIETGSPPTLTRTSAFIQVERQSSNATGVTVDSSRGCGVYYDSVSKNVYTIFSSGMTTTPGGNAVSMILLKIDADPTHIGSPLETGSPFGSPLSNSPGYGQIEKAAVMGQVIPTWWNTSCGVHPYYGPYYTSVFDQLDQSNIRAPFSYSTRQLMAIYDNTHVTNMHDRVVDSFEQGFQNVSLDLTGQTWANRRYMARTTCPVDIDGNSIPGAYGSPLPAFYYTKVEMSEKHQFRTGKHITTQVFVPYTSITASGTTYTVDTGTVPHRLLTNARISVTGNTSGNVTNVAITVTSPTSFTYTSTSSSGTVSTASTVVTSYNATIATQIKVLDDYTFVHAYGERYTDPVGIDYGYFIQALNLYKIDMLTPNWDQDGTPYTTGTRYAKGTTQSGTGNGYPLDLPHGFTEGQIVALSATPDTYDVIGPVHVIDAYTFTIPCDEDATTGSSAFYSDITPIIVATVQASVGFILYTQAIPLFINGKQYITSLNAIDLTTVAGAGSPPPWYNTTFYVYIEIANTEIVDPVSFVGQATVSVYTTLQTETPSRLFLGTVTTNTTGIDVIDIDKKSLVGGNSVEVISTKSSVVVSTFDGDIHQSRYSLPVVSITGTGSPLYQNLSAEHENVHLLFNNVSAIDYNILNDSTVDFPIDGTISLSQNTTFAVTFVAGAGVTLNSAVATPITNGQWSRAFLRKTAANTWTISGNII